MSRSRMGQRGMESHDRGSDPKNDWFIWIGGDWINREEFDALLQRDLSANRKGISLFLFLC